MRKEDEEDLRKLRIGMMRELEESIQKLKIGMRTERRRL